MEVRLKVGSGSLVLQGEQGVKAVRAGIEGIWVTAQKYPATLSVALSLDAMGIISPEGAIVKTGSDLQHSDSMPALNTGGALPMHGKPSTLHDCQHSSS